MIFTVCEHRASLLHVMQGLMQRAQAELDSLRGAALPALSRAYYKAASFFP